MDENTTDYIAGLERKVANYQRLIEINNVLNSVLLRQDVGIDSLLRYLMDTSVEMTDCEGASVLLWDEDRRGLVFAATTTQNKASRELVGKVVPLDSIAGTIFKERRMVEVDDTAHDPRHYDEVDTTIQFKTRSLLGVPLLYHNRAIGVLEVVNKRTLPWTEEDRNNLTILAGEAAIAIQVGKLVVDLQRMNAELSELDKLKSDFIAIASHELRTPLGVIMGYSSFLLETEDDTIKTHSSKIMESALQLRRIIESMINLRYIKQKSTELHRQAISLETIIEDLEREMATLTQASAFPFDFLLDDPTAHILVDRSRLVMALTNLLNNAISFSKPGDLITVRAWVEADEAYIAIIDRGIGLEADQLERIFEEFYQVEDHMIRRHGGLGIGLSIAQALIKAHKGRIWAESAGLGHGATFTVALPLVE